MHPQLAFPERVLAPRPRLTPSLEMRAMAFKSDDFASDLEAALVDVFWTKIFDNRLLKYRPPIVSLASLNRSLER
jgi:hypothetical protein